jgi:hypothetical protein
MGDGKKKYHIIVVLLGETSNKRSLINLFFCLTCCFSCLPTDRLLNNKYDVQDLLTLITLLSVIESHLRAMKAFNA